jgi:hypothetical protein
MKTMIWPGMILNLCLGLLAVAYLLRVLRRYEACVDAIIAKLDKDQETSTRNFDAARDEIRTSMRIEIDPSIAKMQATIERFRATKEGKAKQEISTENRTEVEQDISPGPVGNSTVGSLVSHPQD